MKIYLLGYCQYKETMEDKTTKETRLYLKNYLRLFITGTQKEMDEVMLLLKTMWLYEWEIPYCPPYPLENDTWRIMVRLRDVAFADFLKRFPSDIELLRGEFVLSEMTIVEVGKSHSDNYYLLNEKQIAKLSCKYPSMFKKDEWFDNYLKEHGGYKEPGTGTLWMRVA